MHDVNYYNPENTCSAREDKLTVLFLKKAGVPVYSIYIDTNNNNKKDKENFIKRFHYLLIKSEHNFEIAVQS